MYSNRFSLMVAVTAVNHSFLCYQIDKGGTPFWARFKVNFYTFGADSSILSPCLRNIGGFCLQDKMDFSKNFSLHRWRFFWTAPRKRMLLVDWFIQKPLKAASKLLEAKALVVVWLNFIWSLNSRLCKGVLSLPKAAPVTDEPLRIIKATNKGSAAELEFTRLNWTRSSLGLDDDRVRLHTSMVFLFSWFVLLFLSVLQL